MKTEKAFALIALIGVTFKLLMWNGGGIILVLSLSTLSMLYLFLAVYFFSDRNFKTQNIPVSVIGGFILAEALMAILFKLQYWPGASNLLLVASVTGVSFTIAAYFFKREATEELKIYYRNLFLRSIVLSSLCVILILTPSATLVSIQYWQDPELARLKIQVMENPGNREMSEQLRDYEYRRILNNN